MSHSMKLKNRTEPKCKVLVVDDHQETRLITSIFLKNHIACSIVEADSASSAITELQSTDFDLIVCDYRMPNGDGVVVAKNLIEKNIQTSLIFYTAECFCQIECMGQIFPVVEKPRIPELVAFIRDQNLLPPTYLFQKQSK